MELDPDFGEFISSCVARDVRFLVVGGYALAAHGRPRFTKDLDVWIWLEPTNVERLLQALDDFGLGSLGLTSNDFTDENTVVQLGYPPKRIDILTGADGVNFTESWGRRNEVEVGDISVPFIGLNDLIANKRATGRLQDLADVAALTESDEHPDG